MTTSWRMFAHERNGCFEHLGERWWVEIHGLADPVVAVDLGEVREDDPAATHWGWIETGKGAPCMIRKSAIGFRAQFTYGPEAEQERGKGRVVRLAARKAEGEQ